MMDAVHLDSALYRADAEAAYRQIRELGPVVPLIMPDGLRIWAITRYKLGRQVLLDNRLVKSPTEVPPPFKALGGRRYAEDHMVVVGRHMLNAPAEHHPRLRALAIEHFSAAAIKAREPMIESVAHRLLERVDDPTAFDLVAAYARPLVFDVLGEIIGVPESLRPSASRLLATLSERDNPLSPPMRQAFIELTDLLHDLTINNTGHGFIGDLKNAHGKGMISLREIVSAVGMLLAAGTSSTQTAIIYGAVLLSAMPAERQRLLDGPAPGTAVIDELLRYHAPFPFTTWRFTTEPTEIAETLIPAGEPVFVLLAAANRDPRVYTQPDDFVGGRSGQQRHLTFGHGPHYCVGAHLARAEARIALTTLYRRFPDLHPAVPESHLTWRGMLLDRTITSLPVTALPGVPHQRAEATQAPAPAAARGSPESGRPAAELHPVRRRPASRTRRAQGRIPANQGAPGGVPARRAQAEAVAGQVSDHPRPHQLGEIPRP